MDHSVYTLYFHAKYRLALERSRFRSEGSKEGSGEGEKRLKVRIRSPTVGDMPAGSANAVKTK